MPLKCLHSFTVWTNTLLTLCIHNGNSAKNNRWGERNLCLLHSARRLFFYCTVSTMNAYQLAHLSTLITPCNSITYKCPQKQWTHKTYNKKYNCLIYCSPFACSAVQTSSLPQHPKLQSFNQCLSGASNICPGRTTPWAPDLMCLDLFLSLIQCTWLCPRKKCPEIQLLTSPVVPSTTLEISN